MPRKLCFRTRERPLSHPASQDGVDRFTVRYGPCRSSPNSNYPDAASELGGSLMHMLACEASSTIATGGAAMMHFQLSHPRACSGVRGEAQGRQFRPLGSTRRTGDGHREEHGLVDGDLSALSGEEVMTLDQLRTVVTTFGRYMEGRATASCSPQKRRGGSR